MQPAIRFVRRSVRAAVVHVVFVAIQLSLARAANGESSSRPAARRFGQAADCDDSSGATINQQNDACTCTSSHILKPKAGESSWVYSSKGICCNMICKFHGGNTACLAARMTKGDDRKIGAACGTTNVSVGDFLGSSGGFQTASCKDLKPSNRQIVCMCGGTSPNSLSCSSWVA